MTKQETIKNTIEMIRNQVGINLSACTSFPGLKNSKRGKYFNVELADRVSESREYEMLESFAKTYNLIAVEPNGANIVVIFIK